MRTSESKGHYKYYASSAPFKPEVRHRTCGTVCANFGFGALAGFHFRCLFLHARSMLAITLIGGPPALIEVDGFRLFTDPTFDPPGAYRLPYTTLTKTKGPALGPEQVGPVDVVLLSHEQHADNLDHAGRAFLARAGRVLTAIAGEKQLGSSMERLTRW